MRLRLKTLERKTIKVDGVYDIETSNWTQFVVGAILDRTGFYPYTWRREEDYFNSLASRHGTYWAHNGGRYDGLWFLDWVRRARLKAICAGQGQRITNIRMGPLTLCDSFALVPMALSKGSLIGRYPKRETGLECVCGDECGGYCAINRNMSVGTMRRLIEYLEYDCKATLSMLDTLQEYCLENDLDLKNTIGGSSWQTARRTLGLESAQWDWGARQQSASTLYKFARMAYFGGRTELFRPLAEYGWRYDINSAYPAALAFLELPDGVPRETFNRDANKAYRDGLEGLFSCVVRIPQMHIPPLPTRGKDRLVYPFGDISGVWPGNELRYAESIGCRVIRIDTALVWSSKRRIFAPLMERVWGLRDAAGAKSPMGTWLKWFANSLTGRLAIRPEGETLIIGGLNGYGFKSCPADWDCRNGRLHGSTLRRCCIHSCTKKCGATLPLGDWGQGYGIFVRSKWQISDSAHIHYAAYLTAHARITLHKQLVDDDAGGYSTVYCDTDSCFSIVERINNIGKKLGQFKEEGVFTPDDWSYWNGDQWSEPDDNYHSTHGYTGLAPKTYSYYDNYSQHAASKGIEDAVRNFSTLVAGGKIDMNRGVKSLRSALKQDDTFFARKSMSRRVLSNIDENGVQWFGDRWLGPDGATHPQRSELKGYERYR
jgi:hypothetical protein